MVHTITGSKLASRGMTSKNAEQRGRCDISMHIISQKAKTILLRLKKIQACIVFFEYKTTAAYDRQRPVLLEQHSHLFCCMMDLSYLEQHKHEPSVTDVSIINL